MILCVDLGPQALLREARQKALEGDTTWRGRDNRKTSGQQQHDVAYGIALLGIPERTRQIMSSYAIKPSGVTLWRKDFAFISQVIAFCRSSCPHLLPLDAAGHWYFDSRVFSFLDASSKYEFSDLWVATLDLQSLWTLYAPLSLTIYRRPKDWKLDTSIHIGYTYFVAHWNVTT